MSTPVFTTLPTLCSGATEDSNITWRGLGFGLSTVRSVAAGAVKLKSVRTARGRWRHTSTPAQSATRPTAVAIALRRNARGLAAARARRVSPRAWSDATQGGGDQATSPTVTLRTLTREPYHCSKRGLTKTSRLVKRSRAQPATRCVTAVPRSSTPGAWPSRSRPPSPDRCSARISEGCVDQREPGRLHLDHQAVSLQEDVVVVAQWDAPLDRLVGREGAWLLEALVVAAATDLHGDRELVAVHGSRVLAGGGPRVRVPAVRLRVLRIDVDQLDDEVGVAAGGRCEQVGSHLARDREVVLERRAHEREDVRPPVHEALVLYLPGAPVAAGVRGRDRAAPVGHGMRRIRDVLAVRRADGGGGGGGPVEREGPVGVQIQARRLRLRRRPRRVGPPTVRA